jgi:homeobox-leucine zipper protein
VQENRRLQREVAELRALRTTAPYPFYGHLPAAGFSTARVSYSCDNKVITTAHHSAAITAASPVVTSPSPVSTLFAGPNFGAFTAVHPVLRGQPSATS